MEEGSPFIKYWAYKHGGRGIARDKAHAGKILSDGYSSENLYCRLEIFLWNNWVLNRENLRAELLQSGDPFVVGVLRNDEYDSNSEGLKYLREAADNNVFAQVFLAHAPNVPFEEKIMWVKKAAKSGLATAQFSLYLHYTKELYDKKKWSSKRDYWLKEAANQCHYDACMEIGRRFTFYESNFKLGTFYLIKGNCKKEICKRLPISDRSERYYYGQASIKRILEFRDYDKGYNNSIYLDLQESRIIYYEIRIAMRKALQAWCIICNRFGMIRDIRVLIGKYIMELEEEWI